MNSCERAAELTSASYDRKLKPLEFLGLWIHRALCPPCRAYRRQMHRLREHIHDLGDTQPRGAALDDSAKDRIRARLAARKSPE